MNRRIATLGSLFAVVSSAIATADQPAAKSLSRDRVNDPKKSVTWRLTQHPSARELVKGTPLVFVGEAPTGIRTPTAAGFRLEQLRPVRRWIPLTFGRYSSGELVPPDGVARGVQLRIGVLQQEGSRKEDRARVDIAVMNAEAPLHTGGHYRLTWTCRFPKSADAVRRTLEFSITGPAGNLPDAKNASADLPEKYYRVEVLYRRREVKDVLFLGRQVLPYLKGLPSGIAAVGYTADGKSVQPPDPGFARIRRIQYRSATASGWKSKPPLACRTHTHHASMERRNGRWALSVFTSDVGTGASLPTEKGKPTYTLYGAALFRVELLTTNDEPLRQDRSYWKKRIRQIADEVSKSKSVDEKIRKWVRKNTTSQSDN